MIRQLKPFFALTIICAVGVFSCNEKDEPKGKDFDAVTDGSDVVAEIAVEASYNDVDDLLNAAFGDSNSPTAGGRVASITFDDERFTCATIDLGTSGEESGAITIDFGSVGCTGPAGHVRKGLVIFTYTGGPHGTEGFTVVTTFDGYSIDGIALSGTRTVERLTSTGSIKHEITLTDGRADWPDQSYATRSASFVREIFENGDVYLSGNANGLSRRGKSYTMTIDETLVYNIPCAVVKEFIMPVEGIKTFISGTDQRSLSIDYGDGTCDTEVVVSIGNFTAPSFDVKASAGD